MNELIHSPMLHSLTSENETFKRDTNKEYELYRLINPIFQVNEQNC